MKFHRYCLAVILTVNNSASAEDLRALPESNLLRDWLRTRVHQVYDARDKRVDLLATPAEIVTRQDELRSRFLKSLGQFPARTPLHPRIVGSFAGEGYRGEKVIYESQPGFHVPALVYLPTSDPPYPAVLLLCGHSQNGKAAEAYQRACILLAKNGFAVLCPDPIGQAERSQFADDRVSYRATSQHMICGVAPILLGQGLATHMIWDAIRAVDYLESRNDVDASRIGCTGNSGGGNRTAYLMAIDHRIQCAAPGCYITTTRRKNDSPGPGDAEQNTFSRIGLGIEHADFITMRAPRPTLINSATHDFVPIEGAWETYREAKRIYTILGHSERVDLTEAKQKHGFSQPLRVATVRWMRRWLMGKDDAVTESETRIHSDAELQCTSTGQVLDLPGARSVFDLYADVAEVAKQRRQEFRHRASPGELRAKIRSLTQVPPLLDVSESSTRTRVSVHDEYECEVLVIGDAPRFPIPALAFLPKEPNEIRGLCIYAHAEGKQAASNLAANENEGPIIDLVRQGNVVLAVDVRGIGETQMKPWRYGSMSGILGPNSAEFFVAYMLGESFVGMRAHDLIRSAYYLHSRVYPSPGKVKLIATGELTVPALHAAALEPQLFESVRLEGGIRSWHSVVTKPVVNRQLINTLHGALNWYDLPDLRNLVGADRLIEVVE